MLTTRRGPRSDRQGREADGSCLTDGRGLGQASHLRGSARARRSSFHSTRTATGLDGSTIARAKTARSDDGLDSGRTTRAPPAGPGERLLPVPLIIGESLPARSRAGQETEAILACNILNQMISLVGRAVVAIESLHVSVGRGRCGSAMTQQRRAGCRPIAAGDPPDRTGCSTPVGNRIRCSRCSGSSPRRVIGNSRARRPASEVTRDP